VDGELLGIDRVDNNMRVYPADGTGLVACCKACNIAKGSKTVDAFVAACRRVVNTCLDSFEDAHKWLAKQLE
jgi:hypothetical protein